MSGFTDQAAIACTKREVPWGVRQLIRVIGELHPTKNR